MPKAIVIEDNQLEHAVRVANVSSPENGIRDVALLLTCFGTGMTVTEICRLRVNDYLAESGAVLIDSEVRAEIAYNHRSSHKASSTQQARQICDEVYADSEDDGGYGDCVSSAKRRLEKY